MTAQSSILATQINELLEKRTSDLLHEFPQTSNWLSMDAPASRQMDSSSVASLATEDLKNNTNLADFSTLISREEYDEVLQKLVFLQQNLGEQLTQEALLYMEQQLSDLLGFPVTAELEHQQLPHVVGSMIAGKHAKRFPSDVLKNHHAVFEAGIATTRSSFGWFGQQGTLTEEHEAFEQFGISLALAALESFGQDRQRLLHWFKFRKVLVINPLMRTFVVSVVTDLCTSSMQQQYVGSPELVRASNCWAPGNLGKILLLFVDDSSNEIPVGPVATIFNTMV